MNRLKPCVLLLIFFISCSSPPENIIPGDKMIRVLRDVHLANAFAASYGDLDTMKQKTATFLNAIYNKHHIDSARFNRSLRYYTENPSLLNEIYEKVEKDLTRLQDSVIKAEEMERKRLAAELLRKEKLKRDSILRIKNQNDPLVLKPVIPPLWAPFKDYYFIKTDSVKRNRSIDKK